MGWGGSSWLSLTSNHSVPRAMEQSRREGKHNKLGILCSFMGLTFHPLFLLLWYSLPVMSVWHVSQCGLCSGAQMWFLQEVLRKPLSVTLKKKNRRLSSCILLHPFFRLQRRWTILKLFSLFWRFMLYESSSSISLLWLHLLRMAEFSGFCLLHPVFSLYCADLSMAQATSSAHSGYLTDSYGCVQWFWSLSSLISAEWVTRSTWLTLMDGSSDSRVFLLTPLQHSEWKEPVYVKIKTVPWCCSPIVLPMLLMTHTMHEQWQKADCSGTLSFRASLYPGRGLLRLRTASTAM